MNITMFLSQDTWMLRCSGPGAYPILRMTGTIFINTGIPHQATVGEALSAVREKFPDAAIFVDAPLSLREGGK